MSKGSGSLFCEACCRKRFMANCLTGAKNFLPKSHSMNADICLACARKIKELITKIDKKEKGVDD